MLCDSEISLFSFLSTRRGEILGGKKVPRKTASVVFYSLKPLHVLMQNEGEAAF